MPEVTVTLPDEVFERLTSLARAEQMTPEELACERLRRELGGDTMDSRAAREQTKAFVQRRVGCCLTVRDPILEEGGGLMWLVPVVTNVPTEEATFVGQVVMNAHTGEILTKEGEVAAMLKRAHTGLGFRSFPAEKEARLSELLSRAQESPLSKEEQDELMRLVTEQQDLQLANLEQLEARLLPDN
jgi:hypothetical protein